MIAFFGLQLNAQRVIPDEKIIDYSCVDKTLREVLYELSELTKVTIAWQEQIVPGDSLVSLSFRKERLGKVIDFLIVEHELKYKIVGNQISIVKNQLTKVQDKITISGYIKDALSGEALVSASIFLQDKSLGSFSNEYGFYSFTIPKGEQRIYFSYIGYENGIHEVMADKNQTLNADLFPSNNLKEIIITETKLTPIPLNELDVASVDVLPIEQIKSKLPLAGEADVIRMALTMPGVTSGADGFGGVSVRGGTTNQNLILLDGIPVYNAQHAFGLFSIFNPRVVKSAKLYKGAFPSHYSGRLSSVLDVRTREGNYKKFGGEVSVGLLTGSVVFEGPIAKEKASFLFSARRTLVDPWLKAISEEYHNRDNNEGLTEFYFYDINGKFNFNLGKHSKIFFSYYQGKDFFENDVTTGLNGQPKMLRDRNEVSWDIGNTLASVRLNSRLSQKLFVNTHAYISQNNFDAFDHDRLERVVSVGDTVVSFEAGYYQSRIDDMGFKAEFDYLPGSRHRIKMGAGYIKHDFSPGLILTNHVDSLNKPGMPVVVEDLSNELDQTVLTGSELELFFEDNIRFGKFTNLNLGYNHLIVSAGEKTYTIGQPRILFSTGSESYTFKASWGKMGQFLHSLNNTGLGVPIDVWLPSTEKIAPETAWSLTVGNFIQMKRFGIIGMEFFLKKYQNLTRYGTDGLIDISRTSNWEDLIPKGKGESYGSEFSIQKTKGKTTFNVAYTLSWSNRQFDKLNNGDAFRFRYDRRHVFNVGIVHNMGPNFQISANWEYGSGAPITIPTDQTFEIDNEITGNPFIVLIYDKLNNALLPDYHRLDIGFNMTTEYPWGKSNFTLGVYNAYDRRNPLFRDVNPDYEARKIIYKDVTILPILPTISYDISF